MSTDNPPVESGTRLVSGKPTNPPQVDFNAVGKELANDIAVEILVGSMTLQSDRNAAITQINEYLVDTDTVLANEMKNLLHDSLVIRADKERVKNYFVLSMSQILADLDQVGRPQKT